MIAESGKCRVCGCTELRPCLAGGGDGNPLEACSWFDFEKTLCSNLRCVAVTPLADLEEMVARAQASHDEAVNS